MKIEHVLAVVVVLAASASAHGDPAPRVRLPKNQLGVTLGIGTPVGAAGVEYARTLSARAQVAVGVGQPLFSSLEGHAAPQLEVAARARWSGWSLGGGLSGGRFDWIGFEDGGEFEGYALWANGEIGAQTRGRGLFVRGFVGLGVRVLDSGLDCIKGDAADCTGGVTPVVPYLGVTIGRAW
jgi:hypothetical protein